jgi:hypothetical protein
MHGAIPPLHYIFVAWCMETNFPSQIYIVKMRTGLNSLIFMSNGLALVLAMLFHSLFNDMSTAQMVSNRRINS